jgi:hypothetical protein
MAQQLKTQQRDDSVEDFIQSFPAEDVADAKKLSDLMSKSTGEKPARWGSKIIGFGKYTYKYASGRSGDWPPVAFAPRKGGMTLYLMDGHDKYKEELSGMTVAGSGKSCVYLKRLDQIDQAKLTAVVKKSYLATLDTHKQNSQ